MRNWWWLLAAIPAILILRIAGFIGDFWTGLGVVALLAFLAVLEMFPVAVRRYIAVFFAGWVILFLGLPAVWNALLVSFPYTRDALERGGRANDLQASEFIDPVALKAKIGISRYCRELEDVRSEQLNQLLHQHLELQRNPPHGPYGVSVEGTKVMMETLLRQIEKDREECRRLLLGFESPGAGAMTQSQWLQPVKWLWLLGITGAILLGILLFRQKRVWAFALLLAALLAVGWYLTKAERPSAPQVVDRVAHVIEEFTVNANEEADTVATGPGFQYRVTANQPWILLSAVPEGVPCKFRTPVGLCEFQMEAGRRSIVGTTAVGPARVRG